MKAKYTSKQVEEAQILASESRYYGEKVILLLDKKNPLFIYHFVRLIWVSLKFRLKFKDAYLKAINKYRPLNN